MSPRWPHPFLIAHRGAPALAPENTMPSFEAALDAGAETLECDVQLSADGVAVVLHDPRVDRTTDGTGLVRRLGWDRIRRLDAGDPRRFGDRFAGTRVPRLEEVLDLVRGRARVFVEIKPEAVGVADGDASIEARVVAAGRRTGTLERMAVLSFSARALAGVAERAAEVPLGLVFRWWRHSRLADRARAAGAEYLVAYAGRLARRPGIVDEARAAGLRVGAYVVDDAELLATLVAAGVDGFATNRVELLLEPFRRAAAARRDSDREAEGAGEETGAAAGDSGAAPSRGGRRTDERSS